MKNFYTNEYNSLNIFNYLITIIVIILAFCFLAECSHIFEPIPIYIISICLKIIPFILFLCSLLIAKFLLFDRKKEPDNKNTFLQKTITIINILFYFLLIGIAILFLSYESDKHIIKNPNNYAQAIQLIKQKDKISHFPKIIPANAEKVQMYCYTSDNNGEIFILKFNINKGYIEQELKNHKFLNASTQIGTNPKIYYIYTDNNRINVNNTTWYVINNEENRRIYPEYFPYYSSIGISNNLDFIIYYYIKPGD